MIKGAYEVIDRNKDNAVSISELTKTYQKMGIELNGEDVNWILKHIDTNNDGKIDFDGITAFFFCFKNLA